MNDKPRQASVGFAGGQVLPLRVLHDKLEALARALRSGSESWHEVEAEDGRVLLNLGEVVYLRVESEESHVGF